MAEMKDINKLISLTFDENPDVRIRAAEALEKVDDPGAVFALVELSYDKDPRVRRRVDEALNKKKGEEREVLSFAELFSKGKKEGETEEKISEDKKERLLSPILKMFERHLGKEKAERVKKKMMPTIERIYYSSSGIKGVETQEEQGRKVIQEFLTGYLEVMSDINAETKRAIVKAERIERQAEKTAERELPDIRRGSLRQVESELPHAEDEDLERVGTATAVDRISTEIQKIQDDEVADIEGDKELEKLPNTFVKKAYEVMALSGGDDEMMQKEATRMLKDVEKDINLAFKLAKNKFKEKKITNITKIKDGTKNINTDPLLVKEVENIEYDKGSRKKEKAVATRIVVNDETGNEGVVYLFDGRGIELKPGMAIKVVKGQAKTFDFSGETALTVGKKGNIYIVL